MRSRLNVRNRPGRPTRVGRGAAGGGGGGGGGFDPRTGVTGTCTLWLDASDASTLTLSGSEVTGWADKSANGVDLVRQSGVNGPSSGTRTLNGLNVLDYDGTNDNLINTASVNIQGTGSNALADLTLFCVFVTDTVTVGAINIIDADGPSGFPRMGQILRRNGSALETIGFSGGTTPRTDAAGVTLATGTTYIGRVVWDASTTLEAFANGSGNGTSGTAGTLNSAAHALAVGCGWQGGAALGSFFNGAIAEVIAYNSVLSAGDITAVEDYLNTKWGIV